MAQALQKTRANPSYLEFFGLRRPPFGRLPDLDTVYHCEQYTLLLEHLSNAVANSDCLIAVCGADGSGKSTLLDRYMASLGNDVCFVHVDESYKGVKEFYCEFLRQLGFTDIDGKPEELRKITREFIVNRGMAGEPVLLIIDNAHLIGPFILEQLRWLSAIKVDEVRVLSCILAGNSDLLQILDSSAMSQLAFKKYVRFHIRALSESETIDYVWSRLRHAGCTEDLSIAADAIPLIHRFSGGIPRLINILCDAVLQEACRHASFEFTDELLRSVAENRQLVPHVRPYHGQGRRRTDQDFEPPAPDDEAAADGRTQRVDPGAADSAAGPADAVRTDTADPSAAGRDREYRVQIRRLSDQLSELKKEHRRSTAQLASRHAEISELRCALQEQYAHCSTLKEAFERKAGEHQQLRVTLSKRDKSLMETEESKQHLLLTIGKFEEEISALREQASEAAAHRETIAAMREESRRHEEEIAAHASDREAMVGLREQVDELQQRLADAATDRRSLSAARTELDELRDRHAAAGEQNHRLCAELSDAVEGLAGLERELESAREETDALRRELELGRQQDAQKAAHIGDLESIIDTHEQEVALLHARIAGCEDDQLAVADRLREFESLEAYATECEARLTEMQLEIESLRDARAIDADVAGTQESDDTARLSANRGAAEAGDEFPSASAPIRTIEVFHGNELKKIFRIADEQTRIMIGRDRDNDLVLDSNFTSRHHAMISVLADGDVCIEDLNSLNGIVVNEQKLPRTSLAVGDVIVIGEFCLLPGPA